MIDNEKVIKNSLNAPEDPSKPIIFDLKNDTLDNTRDVEGGKLTMMSKDDGSKLKVKIKSGRGGNSRVLVTRHVKCRSYKALL